MKLHDSVWKEDNKSLESFFIETIAKLSFNSLFKLYYNQRLKLSSIDFKELELENNELYQLHVDSLDTYKTNVRLFLNNDLINGKTKKHEMLENNYISIDPLEQEEFLKYCEEMKDTKIFYRLFKISVVQLAELFLGCCKE